MKRPTYTSTSFIKKVFRPGERSLPKNEICNRLEESLLAAGVDQESEALLARVLQMEDSPIRSGRTDAIIELTYQPHQLFDMAYRFLRDTHTPKTVEQIVPELRRQTQFSWNQVVRMLQFERDPRFVQYTGDKRWFLSEWKVANEQMYQFAVENNIQQIAQRSISYFMESDVGLVVKEYVFLPELDDRFRLDGDSLHILQIPSMFEQSGRAMIEETIEEPPHVEAPVFEAPVFEAPETEVPEIEAAETEAPVFETPDDVEEHATMPTYQLDEAVPSVSLQEIAATLDVLEEQDLLTFEEEPDMNITQPHTALTEVNQLLRQALRRLEERNEEMSQKVILYFQQSNMQAIESLMKEKHKNEQITHGIEQLLAAAEQQ